MYLAGLERALSAGYGTLQSGGTSLDAVTAAVVALEDDPLFNAGRGAVYNAAGKHELDASIMEGATLRAGAVAAVSRIRNPVLAARAIMEKTPHVLLAGRSAEEFARHHPRWHRRHSPAAARSAAAGCSAARRARSH